MIQIVLIIWLMLFYIQKQARMIRKTNQKRKRKIWRELQVIYIGQAVIHPLRLIDPKYYSFSLSDMFKVKHK